MLFAKKKAVENVVQIVFFVKKKNHTKFVVLKKSKSMVPLGRKHESTAFFKNKVKNIVNITTFILSDFYM